MMEAAISLDTTGFSNGISKVKSLSDGLAKGKLFGGLEAQFNSLQGKFSGVFDKLSSGNLLGAFSAAEGMGPVMGTLAGALGAVAVTATGMWNAMSRSKELNIAAENAQMTVPQLLALEKAFTRVGGSIENVPALMSHLNQFLGEAQDPASKAARALEKVGLSVKDFEGLSFYEIIKRIASGMDKATDSATRFALASSLGGIKKAAITQAALNPAALEKAEKTISPTAKIYEEQGPQFREFQTNVSKLSVSAQSFFAGVASKVIPELIDATRGIERTEPVIVSAGVQFGSAIAGAMSLIKDTMGFMSSVIEKTPAALGPMGTILQSVGKVNSDTLANSAKSAFMGPLADIFSTYDKFKKAQGGFAGEGSTGDWGGIDKNLFNPGDINAKPEGMPALIASSFTKIGAGGEAWGTRSGDAMMGIQREQLAVQQRMANALERQLANERQTGMGYSATTTPLLGD